MAARSVELNVIQAEKPQRFCQVLALFSCLACAPLEQAATPAAGQSAAPGTLPQGVAWSYRVELQSDLDAALVYADFAPGGASEFSVADGAEPFVSDVSVWEGSGYSSVEAHDDSWRADACASGPCRLRYRFALRSAASQLSDLETAALHGNVVVSPPSAWLLQPLRVDERRDYRFSVLGSAAGEFVSGVWPLPGAAATYQAPADSLWIAPYSAFGEFDVHRLELGGAQLDVAIEKRDLKYDRGALIEWIARSARAIAGYYGGFPVKRALILTLLSDGHFIRGKQLGMGGASVLLIAGAANDASDYARDWKATHEMVHLAVPTMERRHLWLSEGLATYVEPIARAAAGQLTDAQVWRDLAIGVPKGQPGAGDRGLDRTPTWGRTYWGGALFCLVADVEIRKRTGGKRSLRDALRAIVRQGGTTAQHWSMQRFVKVGDEATGVRVLSEVYERMKESPSAVDLETLFRDLGVQIEGRKVTLREDAPLAALRRSITRP